ncbi:ABC transporter substrate-binding protein [Azospirillum sp. B510]|uniref:ABC transporter substrate-binding protein n=1 Tax=Azospirillum sp. (strain B510) TaxID=137722 RepID=UPI0002EA22B4|nr:ABC transporter substrate-binding protein [Azospirillum sp. B510]
MKALPRLLLAIAVCFLVTDGAQARDPSVTFINPGAERSGDVWELMPRFMKAAADQLGLRLEVVYANRDRIRMVELAHQIAARPVPPDYVVLVNEKERAPEMMEAFRGTASRLFLIHNDLSADQRRLLGNERGALANWIGTITADDGEIIRALMGGLYRKTTGEPRIIGIGGDVATPVSALREAAMRDFVAGSGRGRVLQVVPGNWERDDARRKTASLLARYPDANMVWAANDSMALGAFDAVADGGRRAAVRVGGMGAFPQALDSVATGGLAVTSGGNLLTGAWCMVMIRDYDDGVDFAAAGGARQTRGTILLAEDERSATLFRGLIAEPSRIDFRRFLRSADPRKAGYDFSIGTVTAAAR